MNPQPVSLADELRKLIEKWRGLRKSGDAFLSVSAYGTYEMAADELETVATLAAEQPAPPVAPGEQPPQLIGQPLPVPASHGTQFGSDYQPLNAPEVMSAPLAQERPEDK